VPPGVEDWSGALPPARLESLLLELLRKNAGPLVGQHPALTLLKQLRRPWSVELGRAVLQRLWALVETPAPNHPAVWEWRELLREFVRHVPPELAEEALRDRPYESKHWSTWERPIDEFLEKLQFRGEMLKEIAR
jgi:hypothetical protein